MDGQIRGKSCPTQLGEVMANILITRHAGCVAWFKEQGIKVDSLIPHFTTNYPLNDGDVVYGTLPLYLAAHVCAKGARYKSFDLSIPADMRGIADLTLDQVKQCNPRITEYSVLEVK